jgi:hypothetical protein
MLSKESDTQPHFRVLKGETLFEDEEDAVHIHYLQKLVGEEWVNVFHLTLETGRSWGDEIDVLYRHRTAPGELLIHVYGFGYWGDTEYYQSSDHGETWLPTRYRRLPDPRLYSTENLPQV